jgi:hypothetical protein
MFSLQASFVLTWLNGRLRSDYDKRGIENMGYFVSTSVKEEKKRSHLLLMAVTQNIV